MAKMNPVTAKTPTPAPKQPSPSRGLSARVVKAMGLFTGVQMTSILCSLIRTKLVALWIGASGVGLFGIFNNALDTINTFALLGIRNTSVRDLSAAPSPAAVSRIVCIVRRWAHVLGLIGAILTAFFAPLLSRATFGDSSHTLGFYLIAVAVFFFSFIESEAAILQGVDRLKRLAKASMIAAIAGLLLTVPMYRIWGIDSVVPSILVFISAQALIMWLMRARTPRPQPMPSTRQTFREGLSFIKLGIWMTAASAVTLTVNYVFIAWLTRNAGTDVMGYYQAGFTIVNRYIGLVFMAIAMEYYPRLAQVNTSPRRTGLFVSHEMLIALTVILPVAAWMAGLDDIVLSILYKQSFTVSAPFVTWAMAGTAFRAISWCIAFVILARGDGKTYLITESLSSLTSLALNIFAYTHWGLTGLGVAYMLWFAIYTLIVGVVYFRRYRLKLTPGVIRMSFLSVIVLLACALLRTLDMRLIVIAIALASTIFSFFSLRRLLSH